MALLRPLYISFFELRLRTTPYCRLAFLSRLSPWRGLTIFFGLPIIPWGCHGSSVACEVLIACIQRGIVSFVETWHYHGWRHERSADGPRHIRREEGGGSPSLPVPRRVKVRQVQLGFQEAEAIQACVAEMPHAHQLHPAGSSARSMWSLPRCRACWQSSAWMRIRHRPGRTMPRASARVFAGRSRRVPPNQTAGLPDPDPSEHGEFPRILRHRALCSIASSRGCRSSCRTSSW